MKWIKKFLSLFIEKAIEGCETPIGFSYLFQNGWFNDKDWKERTIFFTFPLPINRYGKYVNYCTPDNIIEGERWFTVCLGFRYMLIGKRRIYKPLFYRYWMPV